MNNHCPLIFQFTIVMKIKINNERVIDILDDENLVVANKRLYNKKTKSFEGIDGDLVSFTIGDRIHKGTVEGYTNDGTISIRGDKTIYKGVKGKKIDHISVITSFEEGNKENELLNALSEEF